MAKFKNGVSINKVKERKSDGAPLAYLRISAGPLRGQYVHRLIVAARIGRELNDWEHVDHEDGNTLNDHPSNLSDPLTRAEHVARTNAREKKTLRRCAGPRKEEARSQSCINRLQFH